MESQNRSMTNLFPVGSPSPPATQDIDVDSEKQIVLILTVVAFLILGMIGAGSAMWFIYKTMKQRAEFKRIPSYYKQIPDSLPLIPNDDKHIPDDVKHFPDDVKHITDDFIRIPCDV